MRLHSRPFEKLLRRRVRAAVRASPGLRREYQRAKWRKQYHLIWLIRPLLSLIVGSSAAGICNETNHARAALALLTIFSLTLLCYRAQNLFHCLYRDTDLSAISLLPLAPAAVFRRQFEKFLFVSLFTLGDIVGGLVGLGVAANFSFWQWLLVPPVAALAWGTLLALSAICAARILRYVAVAAVVLTLFWSLTILLRELIPIPLLIRLLDANANPVNLFLPAGWPFAVLQPFLEPGCWFNLALLIPIGLVWWKAVGIFGDMRRAYFFNETPREEAPDEWPEGELDEGDLVAGVPPKHFGDGAIEELVRSRRFLAVIPWETRGLFERWLWRWLAPRERHLMEVTFPAGPNLTARWKFVFKLLAAALALGLIGGRFSPGFDIWIIGAGIFASFILALASLAETGQAFRPIFCGGVNIPFYALQGIGYRELVRVLSKCAAVQIPAVVLWSVASGLAFAHLAGLTMAEGMMRGGRAGAMLFAGRWILLVFNFSGGTNDSSRRGVASFLIFVSMAGFGGLFLILGMTGLCLPDSLPTNLLTLASMFCAWALIRTYGWFYHRNRFDLMSRCR